jgi:hypothetical protein
MHIKCHYLFNDTTPTYVWILVPSTTTLRNIKLINCVAGTMTDVKNKVNIDTKFLTF